MLTTMGCICLCESQITNTLCNLQQTIHAKNSIGYEGFDRGFGVRINKKIQSFWLKRNVLLKQMESVLTLRTNPVFTCRGWWYLTLSVSMWWRTEDWRLWQGFSQPSLSITQGRLRGEFYNDAIGDDVVSSPIVLEEEDGEADREEECQREVLDHWTNKGTENKAVFYNRN